MIFNEIFFRVFTIILYAKHKTEICISRLRNEESEKKRKILNVFREREGIF